MGNKIRDALLRSLTAATKKYTKVKKAEERRPSLRWHRRAALYSSRVTIKSAAWEVMERAYLKASANGTLPAHARQIMYAARGRILERTGQGRLDDQYFTQTLLPDYIQEHPAQTAAWDVVFDARGHFAEPHTEKTVPLGTLDVRRYLRDVETHQVKPPDFGMAGTTDFPTCGPRHRFGAILFIEKEGFLPLFDAVHLAERYDLAIMSTKGLSSTAGRRLVDELCGKGGVPLLVLHDFDKSGFSILATLQRATRRYRFRNRVEAIDLGLRLVDVEAQGLEAEEVAYKGNPIDNLRENGATEEEIAFLYDGDEGGQRVELNAFASDALIAWIEEKLAAHGITKVIPDGGDLAAAYKRALHAELLRARLGEIDLKAAMTANQAEILGHLADTIREELDADPKLPWDEAMTAIARKAVEEGEVELPDDEPDDEAEGREGPPIPLDTQVAPKAGRHVAPG